MLTPSFPAPKVAPGKQEAKRISLDAWMNAVFPLTEREPPQKQGVRPVHLFRVPAQGI